MVQSVSCRPASNSCKTTQRNLELSFLLSFTHSTSEKHVKKQDFHQPDKTKSLLSENKKEETFEWITFDLQNTSWEAKYKTQTSPQTNSHFTWQRCTKKGKSFSKYRQQRCQSVPFHTDSQKLLKTLYYAARPVAGNVTLPNEWPKSIKVSCF